MATFLLYGDIIAEEEIPVEYPYVSSRQLAEFVEANKDEEELTIRINSRGGSIQEGFLMYDLLKNSGKKVTTIGDGKVCSIATVVFLAGAERIMMDNSYGLIHMPFIPKDTLDGEYESKDLERIASDLKREEEKILHLYGAETGYNLEELRVLMTNETNLTADEMVKYGFATKKQQPLKAVAYISNHLKNQKMEDLEVRTTNLFDKFEKFLNKFSKIVSKNMDVTDATGVTFTVEREEGEIQVGDVASPDGTYTLEDGSVVVVAEGVIASITPAEDNTLEEENKALKAKLAEYETQAQNFAAAEKEMKSLVTELKALKSTVTMKGRQQNFKEVKGGVDAAKVIETLNKLKEGK